MRTKHLRLDEAISGESNQREGDDNLARISGIPRPEFPEPTPLDRREKRPRDQGSWRTRGAQKHWVLNPHDPRDQWVETAIEPVVSPELCLLDEPRRTGKRPAKRARLLPLRAEDVRALEHTEVRLLLLPQQDPGRGPRGRLPGESAARSRRCQGGPRLGEPRCSIRRP
jgi:hypothetical protein